MVVGDLRWAGAYGVNADFVARTHCSVEFISTEDIMVRLTQQILNLSFFFLSFLLQIVTGHSEQI